MSKIGLWSTTPGSNNATPPDGWPEGQAPSTINDCAREMMASIRTFINDSQYVDLGNVPSFLSSTTFSLGTADSTNFHVGRRLKMMDAATQYGTIDSASGTFISVRLDAGSTGLTAQFTSVAVSALTNTNPAVPHQVWVRRNILINGSMEIWQRGSSFSPANNTLVYTADRACYLQSASCALNITRGERSAASANVPSIAQAGMYLNSSLKVSVSAADASLAAGEFSMLMFRVEGYDWRQIAHKPNVLSFWNSTNRSGIYCVALRCTTGSLSYVQNYTVSAVNTWSRFAITIPEAPTTAAWDYSSGVGLIVSFCLGSGSTGQGGAGNWTAANVFATSSQQNFVASAGNVFMVTGLQLEEGTQATPLEIKNYQDELVRCQRYFNNMPVLTTNGGLSTAIAQSIVYPSPMRSIPNLSAVTTGGAGSDISFFSVSSVGFRFRHAAGTGATDFSVSADAEL